MPWPLSGRKVKADDDNLLPLSVPTIKGIDRDYDDDDGDMRRSRPRSRSRGHIRTTSAQSRVGFSFIVPFMNS